MAHRVTHAELLARLHYAPETGVWTWLYRADRTKAWNSHYAGKRAGHVGNGGYRCIRIHRFPYQSYRLAWFYMTGEWPAMDMDHKNRIRDDDRWENLREATRAQQNANRAVMKCSRSGIKGAIFVNGRWEARIRMEGKRVCVGRFNTAEEAGAAYAAAAKKYHGEFVCKERS